MSGSGGSRDDGATPPGPDWLARASSLPGSLRLAAGSLGGELARVRSFFLDAAPPSAARDARSSPLLAPDGADATTRLEVLTAPEINFSVLSVHVASLVAVVYVLVVTHAARAAWEESGALAQGRVWGVVSVVLRDLFNAAIFVLPLLYALRLATARKVVPEQVWTVCLLSAGLFCENPLTDLFYSLRTLRHAGSDALAGIERKPVAARHHAAGLVVSDATYTVVVYLYLLLSAHSYRVLDSSKYSRAFYLPKLIAGAAYFGVKVALGFGFRIALGLVPFARLLTLYYLQQSGRSGARLVLPVLITTVLDVAFMMWVMREVRRTARFLARVPYLENRSKQLGFRCFVYQTLMLFFNLVLVASVLQACLPRGVLEQSYDWAVDPTQRHRFIQLEAPVGQLALALVYITWNVIIAYVNLPPGPIMPYTVSALRSLAVSVLPEVLTARHRWPVWMPGYLPHEPDYIDASSDSEEEAVELTGEVDEELVNGLQRSRTTGSIATMLAQDALSGSVAADQAQAAQAEVSWRAGIPRGEQCPLRYRLREWHERPTRRLPVPPSPASRLASVSHVDAAYSGEKRDEDDALLSHTSIVGVQRGGEAAAASSSFFSLPSLLARTGGVYAGTTAAVDVPHIPRGWLDSPSPQLDGESSADFYSISRALSPPPALPPAYRGRLITRKNLFVMESQLVLANAMYLCYIPGNKAEERPKSFRASHNGSGDPQLLTGSFGEDMQELDSQLQDENRNGESASSSCGSPADESSRRGVRRPYTGRDYTLENDLGTHDSSTLGPVASVPEVSVPERQPDHDDGTMFLVDPEEMASKHGYHLYRHIRHDASNGHAIVLVGQDRVIVAFSGTRDAKNWVTNSRFMRAPWDDMFRTFASEPSDTDPDAASDAAAPSVGAAEKAPDVETGLGSGRAHQIVSRSEQPPHGPNAVVNASTPASSAAPLLSSKTSLRRHSASVTALTQSSVTGAIGAADGTQTEASSAIAPVPQSHASTPLLRRSRSEEHVASNERLRLLAGARSPARGYGSASMQRGGGGRGCDGTDGGTRMHGSGAIPRGSGRRTRSGMLLARRRGAGVSEIEDMATALAQELVTYGHAKVHLGFAQAYGKLRNRVMGALVELYGGRISGVGEGRDGGGGGDGLRFERDVFGRVCGVERGSCRGLPLFVTGHSLGGVLATFCSYESARWFRHLGLRRRQDVACTTFGSPMPGNSVFKQRYERMVETHWRFEFACDPVAALPGVLNYEPVGTRVLLDQAGWMMIDPSVVEAQWWGRLAHPLLAQRLHFRASYIAALQVVCRRYRPGGGWSGGGSGAGGEEEAGVGEGGVSGNSGVGGEDDTLADRFWEYPIACQVRNLFPSNDDDDPP